MHSGAGVHGDGPQPLQESVRGTGGLQLHGREEQSFHLGVGITISGWWAPETRISCEKETWMAGCVALKY